MHFLFSATITIDCGGTTTQVTTPETTIQSPNYPSNYPHDLDCTAVVQFAQGQRVSVEFLAFNLESDSTCRFDWLEIRDGSDSSADLLSTRLCGEQLVAPITSTGNTLHIQFHTDHSRTKSGFQLKVKIGRHHSLYKQRYIILKFIFFTSALSLIVNLFLFKMMKKNPMRMVYLIQFRI